jgi:hypothetical protein
VILTELLHIRLERLIQRLSSKESGFGPEEEVAVKDENSKDVTNVPETPPAPESASA